MESVSIPEICRLTPRGRHTHTVIFLHGLGQTVVSWREVVGEALAPHFPHTEWLLPQATRRPVAMNQNQKRHSWFNVSCLPPNPNEYDEHGITASIACVENLITQRVYAGIDPRRIVLVGFSQGAALASVVALTSLHDLGGVACLSGWIPHRARQDMERVDPNLRFFFGHGTHDQEVPLGYAEESIGFLRHSLRMRSGMIQFHRYPGIQHGICDQELDDLVAWLKGLGC